MEEITVFNQLKKEIQQHSQKEIDAINKDIKEVEDNLLSSIKKEAENDTQLKLKQQLEELNTSLMQEISLNNTMCNQKLITLRDEYVQNIFNEAKEELIKFTKTDEYKVFMINKIKKFSSYTYICDQLKIRKEDEVLKDELIKAYGHNIDVIIDENILIGGFILEDTSSNVVINESLEFILENQKDDFAKTSGLIIK